jgi:hypothetical protein
MLQFIPSNWHISLDPRLRFTREIKFTPILGATADEGGCCVVNGMGYAKLSARKLLIPVRAFDEHLVLQVLQWSTGAQTAPEQFT